MRRSQTPFNGKRFLLNINTGEIHDLDNETAECKIDKIKPEHIRMDNSISSHDREQVLYTLIKLFEGGYINAQYERSPTGQLITFRVYDMTFQGHEFLEKIRSETVWDQKLKPVFTTIGSMSLDVISNVANSVITSLVLKKLNL